MMINRSHRADLPQGAGAARRGAARDAKPQRQGLRGRLDQRAARRDRRALRPDRRRPQRVRHERVRPQSQDRRRNPLEGPAGRHPQRAPGDRARHRAGAREPARPGAQSQSADRTQPQPADLRPADARHHDLGRARRPSTPTGRSAICRSRRRAGARSPRPCRAATSRRSSSASGSTTAPSCSSSTSRRWASTSAPRPKSTGCSAQLLKNGAGIILISSYLPEVYELADTLHVFRSGRLAGSNGFRQSSHEEVLAEAIGV